MSNQQEVAQESNRGLLSAFNRAALCGAMSMLNVVNSAVFSQVIDNPVPAMGFGIAAAAFAIASAGGLISVARRSNEMVDQGPVKKQNFISQLLGRKPS